VAVELAAGEAVVLERRRRGDVDQRVVLKEVTE
jgi:hypothetical protein